MQIPKTMKALVAKKPGEYVLETNWPTPECGPDDIILKVEGCGVCAGDLKCMGGAAMFWGDDVQPSWVEAPFIPGHEFIGRIVQMGENVKGYELGQRLAAEQIVPCWECRFCKTGQYWMCEPHRIFGFFSSLNGGMAEYIRLPKEAVKHVVPSDLPLEKALLIEPYSCSKHCVDRANISCEDVVVIAGAGTLGLGMVTYAKQRSPKTLIVLDMVDSRLEKAKEFGADIVMNPGKVDAISEVKRLTDNYGCDVYIEATGHPSAVEQGLQMIRKLGRFIEFSVFSEPATVDWSIIGDRKELDVLGAHLSPYCFNYVINAIADGTLKTDGIINKTFPLEQWEQAFDAATGKYGDLKVAIVF